LRKFLGGSTLVTRTADVEALSFAASSLSRGVASITASSVFLFPQQEHRPMLETTAAIENAMSDGFKTPSP
jgi:hypothetical protein